MKHSYKAALFSALIYPGSGHLLLKHYPMGILFAGTASACLIALVARAFDIAQTISDKLLSGEIPLDATRLSEAISNQSAAAGSTLTSIATWLLVACWIISSADAFRLGRRLERAAKPASAG